MEKLTNEQILSKIDQTKKLYSGLDHHCRCGCGGKYYDQESKSWKMMLTRVRNAVKSGKIIESRYEGFNNDKWINLSMDNNKAYTLYF